MPLAPSTLHGLQILSERKARDFFKISEFSSVKQYVLENQAVPTTFGPPWMSFSGVLAEAEQIQEAVEALSGTLRCDHRRRHLRRPRQRCTQLLGLNMPPGKPTPLSAS